MVLPTNKRLQVGDRVRMKKLHPCGGREWEVWRVGMDVGLKCLSCGRKVRVLRSKLEKSIKNR